MLRLKQTQILWSTKKEIGFSTIMTFVKKDHDRVSKQNVGAVNPCNCPESMNSNTKCFKLHRKQNILGFYLQIFPHSFNDLGQI